jgi:hypothetical protein
MTPSQLEAARLRAEHLLTRPTDEPRWSGEREMLETFLSATTPPSEEELAEEARAWLRQMRAAGARREGRK